MRQAAWKAAVANVSDLAAKGVKPFAGLVSLGLPAHLRKFDVAEIGLGLQDAAKRYGFPFVGGDTNESRDLTISIFLIGVADPKRIVLRSGAEDGDLIAVTGEFGATTAGLKALLKFREKPGRLPRTMYEAVFRPRAELDLGLRLAASGALTSSMDSSDGLAWTLHELSAASNVGMLVHKVPISREAFRFAADHHLDSTDLALYGGEEYHLVVTVRAKNIDSAIRASRGRLRVIGVVTSRFRGVRMARDGREVSVERRGWEHFVKPGKNRA
jgi:thiamine-monophosphate kinase